MSFHRFGLAVVLALSSSFPAHAQSTESDSAGLLLELNTLQDENGACNLIFFVQNQTGQEIEKAKFETVIFNTSGSVDRLVLFDFRDLPSDRPRVRRFSLPNLNCTSIGRLLINGANSCIVGGSDSKICMNELKLNSRLDVELLG